MPQFCPNYDVISKKKKVFTEILTVFSVKIKWSPKKKVFRPYMLISKCHSDGPSAEASGLPEAHGSPKVHGPRGHCTPLHPPLGGPDEKYHVFSTFETDFCSTSENTPLYWYWQWECVYFLSGLKKNSVSKIDPRLGEDLIFGIHLISCRKQVQIWVKIFFFWSSPSFGHKTFPIPSENSLCLVLLLRTPPPPPHSSA